MKKPCPFCGCLDIALIIRGFLLKKYLCQCSLCEATGPIGHTSEMAWYFWNARDESTVREFVEAVQLKGNQ